MADQAYSTKLGGVTIAEVPAPAAALSQADVQQIAGQVAAQQIAKLAVPVPASSSPPGVANSGAPGTVVTQYALADHTHASRMQRGKITTGSDGKASWAFPKAFTMEPITSYMVQKDPTDTGGPVAVEVISYTIVTSQDGIKTWTGLTVQAMRATRALPSMSLTTLLTGLITALSGFLLQQTAAAGLTINISAGEPTPN